MVRKSERGFQLSLPIEQPHGLSNHFATAEADDRGAVFTRREVVEFILNLIGYLPELPLHQLRLLEPSFGAGDFLIPVVERLIESYLLHTDSDRSPVDDLSAAIRAVEVHPDSVMLCAEKLVSLLHGKGIEEDAAEVLVGRWLIEGDFLLSPLPHTFSFVVGNPPYVRQEAVPNALMAEYRRRFRTIYDRADLYVPFIERGLLELAPGGALGFICADRWMKNRYGGPLRKMVAQGFHLSHFVDMIDTEAFLNAVSAYPAIMIIRHEEPGITRIAYRPAIEKDALSRLAREMRSEGLSHDTEVIEAEGVPKGSEPWLLGDYKKVGVLRRIEERFPALEDAGCRVGIGVATGADRIFIGEHSELPVEPSRKLPLAKTRDISNGQVAWRGLAVINPFTDSGSLVDLAEYPLLRDYLEKHRDAIQKRNCAKKNPSRWYRTIDRIYPALATRPKLLIPDIKNKAHVVYEDGKLYPHHNLYYITSDEWDLRALQAVLLSDVARLFIQVYSTEMRGGYLRFQAQYLRRIRVPRWSDVSADIRSELRKAGISGDVQRCNAAAFTLYELDRSEQEAITARRKANEL